MKKRHSVLTAVVAAGVVSVAVRAEETTLNPVIITTTRTAQTADDNLAAVTVLTREDIERSQAKTAAELLAGTPGMNVSVNGGYGKTTSVFLRGTNSDHVIVLVDGTRVGSATLGGYSWEFLPIEQIERIEIVRGPRSSLYGADAIGGVIQIFTRKGQEGFHGGATVGYGTFESREYTANASGAGDGFHYSVGASRYQTDGINARNVAVAKEPDSDGYRNNGFNTRMGYDFGNGTTLDAHLLHSQGHSEFDGNPNQTDFIQNTLGTELKFAPTTNWVTKLQGGHGRDENDSFKDGVFLSNFYTRRRTLSWQNDVTLAPKQLATLGVDYQDETVSSTTAYNASERRNMGYFVQHQAGFGAHDVTLNLREDNNQAFGTHGTGGIAWGYAIDGESLRLVTSYGTAFKAPTFNQLFYPGIGNPNLKPETSESYEIGLRGKAEQTTWSITAYQTNIENLIIFQPPTFQAFNINKARIVGLENEIAFKTDNNRLAFNLTYLDPRDVETDKLLPRRPQRDFKADEEYTLRRWHLGGTWLMQSYRFDNPQNTTRVGGYCVVDMHARYDMGKYWFLKARAGNIFDKQYETVATYNSPGRNYFVTLGYQQ